MTCGRISGRYVRAEMDHNRFDFNVNCRHDFFGVKSGVSESSRRRGRGDIFSGIVREMCVKTVNLRKKYQEGMTR